MYRFKKIIILLALISFGKMEASFAQQANASPYTLPWQLRSVVPSNVVRHDSALAFYRDATNSDGFVAANVVTGSYKVAPSLAISARVGWVANDPPTGTSSALVVTNPLLGGLYSLALTDTIKMGLFLGMTVPVGMGGGDSPDPDAQAANAAGILARSAMDNALFAVNYFAIIPGLDLAYISNGLTVQAEATLLQYARVRGSSVEKDSARTNFTSGLELGYALCSYSFVQGEIRYQRWLHNDTVSAAPNPSRQNLSFAVGPRFQFKTGNMTFKPGIAYAQGISGPIAKSGFTSATHGDKIVFVDLPISF